MKYKKLLFSISVLIVLALMAGGILWYQDRKVPAVVDDTNGTVNTDIDNASDANGAMARLADLGTMFTTGTMPISLPSSPQSASWQVLPRDFGGSQDWAFVGVLTFDDVTLNDILASLPREGEIIEGRMLPIQEVYERVATWLPPSIKPFLVPTTEGDGNVFLINARIYDAGLFMKKPFRSGYFFVFEKGKIFLYMTTAKI